MNMTPSRLLAVTLSLLLLSACDKSANEAAKPFVMPPPEVSVVVAQASVQPLTQHTVGRIVPVRSAEVRARVDGIVLRKEYLEGLEVKSGQTLFQIDPAELEATLQAQQAALAQAKASAANAALNAKRSQDMANKKLISPQDLDNALANERALAAEVQQAQAELAIAQLKLSYATVTSPIAGRVSSALVSEGALVDESEATLMAKVDQLDPIHVYFSLPPAALGQTTLPEPNSSSAQVKVTLADDQPYPHQGKLNYQGAAVDKDTGAVSLRALLPNPENRLLPGMFVKVELALGQINDAFVLPQAAVNRDAKGAFVFTVNAQDVVEQRRIQTHQMTGSDWVITGELKDEERVIVSGVQKVRPGANVKVTPTESQTAPATAPAQSAKS